MSQQLKRYLTALFLYIFMQLSSIIGIPVIHKLKLYPENLSGLKLENYMIGLWGTLSFSLTMIVVIFIVRKELFQTMYRSQTSFWRSIGWAINGIFLAFFAQMTAALTEQYLFGINPGSENTADLISIAKVFPFFIIVISIVAPILEEIVFRGIIFQYISSRTNFWVGVLASSALFAAVHFDFEHFLVYLSMGFVFSYLYHKTKRLSVPIIAHVAMNTFVVLIQFTFVDEIEKIQSMTALLSLIIK